MRDDFPPAVKEILAKRVGFRCSNPVCRQLTSGPQVDTSKAVNVGVASHIAAASRGGPRADDSLTPEQRKHPDNGIWLCQKCGKLVDNDVVRYPEEFLRDWKRQAEETAIREVEGGPATASRSPADVEPAWVGLSRRFEKELEARNLSDRDSDSFAKTRYNTRQQWVKGRGVVEPFPVRSLFFAWLPRPFVSDTSGDRLLRWMDCNERRYEPCRARSFIPSPSHTVVPKGFVWDDSWQAPLPPPARFYTRYLAVEPGGWIEYGYYPGAEWEDRADRVYYARAVASFVAFLSFVRETAAQFQIAYADIGLGLALRGTAGKQLLCVREEGLRMSYHTEPPARDTLCFVRSPAEEDWTVDGIAGQAADEILEHWSFWGEPWVGRPEFKDGIYEGILFKNRFQAF